MCPTLLGLIPMEYRALALKIIYVYVMAATEPPCLGLINNYISLFSSHNRRMDSLDTEINTNREVFGNETREKDKGGKQWEQRVERSIALRREQQRILTAKKEVSNQIRV